MKENLQDVYQSLERAICSISAALVAGRQDKAGFITPYALEKMEKARELLGTTLTNLRDELNHHLIDIVTITGLHTCR